MPIAPNDPHPAPKKLSRDPPAPPDLHMRLTSALTQDDRRGRGNVHSRKNADTPRTRLSRRGAWHAMRNAHDRRRRTAGQRTARARSSSALAQSPSSRPALASGSSASRHGLPAAAAAARRRRGGDLGEPGVDLGDEARPLRVLRRALGGGVRDRSSASSSAVVAAPSRRRPRSRLGLRRARPCVSVSFHSLLIGSAATSTRARAIAVLDQLACRACASVVAISRPSAISVDASSFLKPPCDGDSATSCLAQRERLLVGLDRARGVALSSVNALRELGVRPRERAPVRRRSWDRCRRARLRMSSAMRYCAIAVVDLRRGRARPSPARVYERDSVDPASACSSDRARPARSGSRSRSSSCARPSLNVAACRSARSRGRRARLPRWRCHVGVRRVAPDQRLDRPAARCR